MKYLRSFEKFESVNEGIFDIFNHPLSQSHGKKNLELLMPIFKGIEEGLRNNYHQYFRDSTENAFAKLANGSYGEHRFYLDFDKTMIICSYDDDDHNKTTGNNFYVRTSDREIAQKFGMEVSEVQYKYSNPLYAKVFKFHNFKQNPNTVNSGDKVMQDIFDLIEDIYFHIYRTENLVVFLAKTNLFKKYFYPVADDLLVSIMKKQGDYLYLDVDEFYNVFMGSFKESINEDPGIDHFEKVFNILLSILKRSFNLFEMVVVENTTYIKIESRK